MLQPLKFVMILSAIDTGMTKRTASSEGSRCTPVITEAETSEKIARRYSSASITLFKMNPVIVARGGKTNSDSIIKTPPMTRRYAAGMAKRLVIGDMSDVSLK